MAVPSSATWVRHIKKSEIHWEKDKYIETNTQIRIDRRVRTQLCQFHARMPRRDLTPSICDHAANVLKGFNNSIHNSYKRAILLQNLCVRKIPTLENISLTLSTPQKQSYQRILFDFTFSKASKNNHNKNDKIMQRDSLNITAIRRGYKILDFENV